MKAEKILVPVDFSESSDAALDWATVLARDTGATKDEVEPVDAGDSKDSPLPAGMLLALGLVGLAAFTRRRSL